jgi:hypothetical protein
MKMPEYVVQKALEVLFETGKIYHETNHVRPMHIEDCWVCGINRSICMDTECKGDYELLKKARFCK